MGHPWASPPSRTLRRGDAMALEGLHRRSSPAQCTREKIGQARATCREPSSSSCFVYTAQACPAALTSEEGPLLLAEEVAPVGWAVVAAVKAPESWRSRALQRDRVRPGVWNPRHLVLRLLLLGPTHLSGGFSFFSPPCLPCSSRTVCISLPHLGWAPAFHMTFEGAVPSSWVAFPSFLCL